MPYLIAHTLGLADNRRSAYKQATRDRTMELWTVSHPRFGEKDREHFIEVLLDICTVGWREHTLPITKTTASVYIQDKLSTLSFPCSFALTGISFPIASKGLEQCLAFGVNSCARRALADSQIDCVHPDTVLGKVTAGAVVGVVNSIVSTPVELVKIKLQTQGANSSSIAQSLRTAAPSGYSRAVPYRGSFHCALSIINSEGLVGLYR